MLLNFCEFHENRRREYRTFLKDVNENTFMPIPWNGIRIFKAGLKNA